MVTVQIFGLKNSQATRAAERFFKERSATIHLVNLSQRPMSPGEIRRFVDRFGLPELVDRAGKAWVDSGLAYFRLTDAELLAKLERDPSLLRLPFVRSGSRLSIGRDEASWKEMLTPAA